MSLGVVASPRARRDPRLSGLRAALAELYRFHTVLRYSYVLMFFNKVAEDRMPAGVSHLESLVEFLFSLTDAGAHDPLSVDLAAMRYVIWSL